MEREGQNLYDCSIPEEKEDEREEQRLSENSILQSKRIERERNEDVILAECPVRGLIIRSKACGEAERGSRLLRAVQKKTKVRDLAEPQA